MNSHEPIVQSPAIASNTPAANPSERGAWSINGLDVSLSLIEGVQRSLIRAAEMLREGDMAPANRFFAQCIECIERFYQTMTQTKTALGIDFGTIQLEQGSLAMVEEEFSDILKAIIHAQERKDFASVADEIEFGLLPNLSSWKRAIGILRSRLEGEF